MAALPSELDCAVPSAIADDVIVCVEVTEILLSVVIALDEDSIAARAVLRAAVTAANGTIETDPAPAPLASASVDEFCTAAMVKLSGSSDPVKFAPPSNTASTSFLWVATAIDAPMPNVPPSLKSNSSSEELSLESALNKLPETSPA